MFLFFATILIITGFFAPSSNAQNPPPQTNTAATSTVSTTPCKPIGGTRSQSNPPLSGSELTEELDYIQGSDTAFTIVPPLEEIDETLPCVDVTFHNMTEGGTYYICSGDRNCLKQGKVDKDNVKKKEPEDAEGSDVTFRLCGDGDDAVKVGPKCPPDSKTNYFFGGHLYYFSVVSKSDDDEYFALKNGAFFVGRSYPDINISPNSGLTTQINNIRVTLTGGLRPSGSKSSEKRNNYQIRIKGGEGYDKVGCIDTVSGSNSVNFPNITKIGKYTITVSGQIDEGDADSSHPNKITNAVNSNPVSSRKGCKGGDFEYYRVTCDVTNPDPDKGGGKCSDPAKGRDPNGEEYKAMLKELAGINKVIGGSFLPCGDGRRIINNPKDCTSIQTGIGAMEVSPGGFIQTMFRFVLTLAAFGGIIIIIYTGFIFMRSRGDKEQLAAARETLTSAILGLLFIIFSVVILEIIGVDILHIPGFQR